MRCTTGLILRAPALLVAGAALTALAGCGGTSGAQTAAQTQLAIPAVTAPTAYPVAFQMNVSDPAPVWGEPLTVEGRVTGVGDGRVALLQVRRGSAGWRTSGRHPIAADGTYRFEVARPHTGTVRVALAQAPAGGESADTTTAPHVSPAQRVQVRAALSFGTRDLTPAAGKPAVIAGHVRPAGASRTVAAEAYRGGHWQRLTSAQTATDGSYRLAFSPKGNPWIRVVATGDRRVAGSSRLAGYVGPNDDGLQMTATGPMRTAVASRFDDFGLPVACGGTLGVNQQGVAHKTLPCGTMVTITYNGRTVTVPVVDRGPYIAGREFDLTGATANTLGFEGVHPIQVSP